MYSYNSDLGLFDYMELLIDALESKNFSPVIAFESPFIEINPSVTPKSRAQSAALCNMVGYLILGSDSADPTKSGYLASFNEINTARPNSILFNPSVINIFDPKVARENLEILIDFMRARDIDINYNTASEVALGPIPSEYEDTLESVLKSLNLFAKNPNALPSGQIELPVPTRAEGYYTDENENEVVLIMQLEEYRELFHLGRFDPFKLVRIHSVFGNFSLDEWGPLSRMS